MGLNLEMKSDKVALSWVITRALDRLHQTILPVPNLEGGGMIVSNNQFMKGVGILDAFSEIFKDEEYGKDMKTISKIMDKDFDNTDEGTQALYNAQERYHMGWIGVLIKTWHRAGLLKAPEITEEAEIEEDEDGSE